MKLTPLEPTFDANGYPTEATLRTIRKWEIKAMPDVDALLRFAAKAWHWPAYFTSETRRRRPWKAGPLRRRWHVHTGGWSGNESIIAALEKNWMFWSLAWVSSERGGHYVFESYE